MKMSNKCQNLSPRSCRVEDPDLIGGRKFANYMGSHPEFTPLKSGIGYYIK
jgi:hypothetical protein